MKKRLLIVSISIILLFILYYLQWGNKDTIISTSMTETSGNTKTENIIVISNKLFIMDKEKFALDIIQMCINNTLPEGITSNIKLSNDMGYPNKITLTVYRNEFLMKQGIENFKIIYAQDEKYNYRYNVKDNPEKFQITIK